MHRYSGDVYDPSERFLLPKASYGAAERKSNVIKLVAIAHKLFCSVSMHVAEVLSIVPEEFSHVPCLCQSPTF